VVDDANFLLWRGGKVDESVVTNYVEVLPVREQPPIGSVRKATPDATLGDRMLKFSRPCQRTFVGR
jgi:hypothetical protein